MVSRYRDIIETNQTNASSNQSSSSIENTPNLTAKQNGNARNKSQSDSASISTTGNVERKRKESKHQLGNLI
jgi:hypothetical protein